MDLVEKIYKATDNLPIDEKFGITAQIKRAAISIPSNIAEGAGRKGNNEFRHFLSVANGSCCEVETQLLLIKRLNFGNSIAIEELLNLIEDIKNMNYALQKKLT